MRHLYAMHTTGFFRVLAIMLMFCCGSQPTSAQAIEPDTIPFELTAYNNIIVPVVLNGHDTLRLMFHSSFTGIALTREGLQRCTSIRIDGEGTAESWAGSANSSVSRKNSLRIGRHTWDSLMVTIDEQSGQGSDGKFGYDLFAKGALEIDHDRKVMIIHSALPPRLDRFQAIPLYEEDGSLYVEASVALTDSARTDRFMLHTGYGGTAILGTAFMQRLGPDIALDTLGVKKLTDSFGNVLRNVTTRTPAITIGGRTFHDVRIQVMDPRSRFPANVLGGDLLKRFNWVIDLRNKRLLLKPNELVEEPFSERF